MNDTEFAAARDALVDARRRAISIAGCPAGWRPGDLAEAYRLQSAVLAGFGPIAAWKVAAITAAQRQAMGVTTPVAAPIPATHVHDARQDAARLRLSAFISPKIECEFAFELAHDLSPRPNTPYGRAEVAHAVAAMRIGIEIVDPRLPAGSGTLAELADGFNNGAFIAGPAFRDWHGLDLGAVTIVLVATAPGGPASELARGSGDAIPGGDPFGAVVLLANAQPEASRGLRAGDIVTTGSCTGAPRIPGAGIYRAEFTGLGSVSVRLE